ncbi:MAG: sulfite exporter TauE/SafE family protein [Chloroflexi bacterium]|nr:sulfite exporter TauE/SafE family protein [Chloroflexota bacterium]
MDPLVFLAVIVAGFFAGFINTLAGSGSAITLPLLVFLGLPATVANGTNRIGVLFQTSASTLSYHRQGVMPWADSRKLLVPTAIGGIIGALIAVDLNEQQMQWAIAGMLILTFFLLLLKPKRWLQGREEGAIKPGIKEWVIFLAVGIYGGFIQAGVGVFLLVALVLDMGYELVRANAIKSILVLVLNLFALAIFIYNDQVNWLLGFVLAIGGLAGGWSAARMATQEWAQIWVYRLLLVVVVFSAARMLYLSFS